MPANLEYIVLSDIHLGHRNTPTKHIVKNLIHYICSEANKDLDIIFIAGDLFDSLLELNTDVTHDCIHFITVLVKYCYSNNIKLRILEGTPSHDWQQSRVAIKINELKHNKCNLRYFNTLEIEYMADLNIHILYIPDEWTSDHKSLELEIASKLQEYNIRNVDIAILHGQFKYQTLGKNYASFSYEEPYFLNLVKYYIHIGHYHTYSYFDRIIAQGSFDRLSHGEEEEKGYVRVKIDNVFSYKFMPNENSYIYKTIPITKATTLDKLDAIIYKLPPHSFIRLSMSSSHDFNINFDQIKLRYTDYHLKKLIKENLTDKTSVNYFLENNDIDITNLGYTNSNILESLYGIFVEKYKFKERDIERAKGYLEKYRTELLEQT